jgi:hypothetical protein
VKGSGFRVKGSGIRIKSLGGLHIWDFRFFAGQQLRIGRRSRFHDLSAVRFVYRCMIYQKARSQMIRPNTPQKRPKNAQKLAPRRLKMDLKVSSIFRFEKRAQPCLVPSLIEGLRVVQGLRVVPVFLYRYSMEN